MGIHRAANIKQDQQLDRVAPLWPHADIEQATITCGVLNGTGQVKFFGSSLTGKLA